MANDVFNPQKEKFEKGERKELFEKLATHVTELANSGRFGEFLDTMQKFHKYSYNNQALINMQNPSARYVASIADWKSLGNPVINTNEKIMVTTFYENTIHKEVDKKDENGNPVLDKNGKPIKTSIIQKIPNYEKGYVYDVSSTKNPDFTKEKNLVRILSNDDPKIKEKLDMFMTVLSQAYKEISVDFENKKNVLNEQNITDFSHLKQDAEITIITIKNNISEKQKLESLVSKVSEYLIGKEMDNKNKLFKDITDSDKEIIAKSVSYIVLGEYGIDTSDYSFGYVAAYVNDNPDKIIDLSKQISFLSQKLSYEIKKVKSEYEKPDITEINAETLFKCDEILKDVTLNKKESKEIYTKIINYFLSKGSQLEPLKLKLIDYAFSQIKAKGVEYVIQTVFTAYSKSVDIDNLKLSSVIDSLINIDKTGDISLKLVKYTKNISQENKDKLLENICKKDITGTISLEYLKIDNTNIKIKEVVQQKFLKILDIGNSENSIIDKMNIFLKDYPYDISKTDMGLLKSGLSVYRPNKAFDSIIDTIISYFEGKIDKNNLAGTLYQGEQLSTDLSLYKKEEIDNLEQIEFDNIKALKNEVLEEVSESKEEMKEEVILENSINIDFEGEIKEEFKLNELLDVNIQSTSNNVKILDNKNPIEEVVETSEISQNTNTFFTSIDYSICDSKELKELRGTPKQVIWATKVRNELLENIENSEPSIITRFNEARLRNLEDPICLIELHKDNKCQIENINVSDIIILSKDETPESVILKHEELLVLVKGLEYQNSFTDEI